MRLNDLSFVFLQRVWCEHPPSRITEGTSKRRRRAATPSKSKQAAKWGHCRVGDGSHYLVLLGKQSPSLSASDCLIPPFFVLFCFLCHAQPFQLCRLIGFYCTYICFWCVEARCVGCVWMLTRFKTRFLRLWRWFDLLSTYLLVQKPHTHIQSQYSPADKSTIIQPTFNPPSDRDLEFTGVAALPVFLWWFNAGAQSSDWLFTGPIWKSTSALLLPFPLATLHSLTVNKSFFSSP